MDSGDASEGSSHAGADAAYVKLVDLPVCHVFTVDDGRAGRVTQHLTRVGAI